MKKNFIAFLLLLIIQFFSIALFKLVPVFVRNFPLKNTEAVFFSLSQNVLGAKDYAIHLVKEALLDSVQFFLLLEIAIIVITVLLKIVTKKNSVRILLAITICSTTISTIVCSNRLYNKIPVKEYLTAIQSITEKPEHSQFYKDEYIDPREAHITFNEKRNLLLIFLESMEFNFQDSSNGGNLKENLIAEITTYMNQYQSFKPGGTQILGTGWTMADVVAKTCGIPLLFPKGIDGNTLGLRKFLPGAYCLSNLLADQGYQTTFLQGSNLKFASMKYFLETHSIKNNYGFFEFLEKQKQLIDTTTFWGLRDNTLYEITKLHIKQLDESNTPWFLWMQTIDTHTPYGILDKECKEDYLPEEKQYPYVIKCASKQLHRFIEWAKEQSWFEKTTIIVAGDHATMASPETVGFKEKNIHHYWLNFLINSTLVSAKDNRFFSSLDFYPTLVEAIGGNIQEHALGLGRSLFSEKPTLLEKYGLDSLNKMLQKKSLEYDYFLSGN